ncbi:Deoxyuridine 5'-triphosphate nucleotidohydrolase [Mucor velutinosus]|uniref:Deoxyuridine 5'-triphosphate nucleotidohydrolase n=1 Tax=Mucor velutinosus TaxID=708070 RepID=A0AAN7D3W2_9FUNG|nr:Deoxyuridine 5'-triphosphate nucleotidohydrolase [Mucor velutinosus]
MSDTSHIHHSPSQPDAETPLLWTHVVGSKRKGNNKKQQSIVSFNPTLIQRPVTEAEASQQAINGEASSGPMAVIRPFLKGIEEDSVFIDLTPVKDRNLLNKALLKFNEATTNSELYEDFLGYRSKPRHYLGHAFLETMWLPECVGRTTLINDGITLEDGTYLRGFPSYPGDATIVKLTLQNLPFLPALQLKEEMATRLSRYGDVLDHGISRTNGIFQGEGYATLNLTVPSSPDYACDELHPEDKPCPGHRHLEKLSGVMIWDPRSADQRMVLLQWDKMPNFCRICHSADHCRADCPEYKKWIQCYHCDEYGHVEYNCPRNTSPNKVRAVDSKAASKPRKVSQEAKSGTSSGKKKAAPKVSKAPPVAAGAGAGSGTPGGDTAGGGSPGGGDSGVVPGNNQGDGQGGAQDVVHSGVQGGADSQTIAQKQGADRDADMDELPLAQDSDNTTGTESTDTEMGESPANPTSASENALDHPVKKIGKFDGADDFTSAKQQAAVTAAAQGQQQGLTGPPSPSQH